MDHLSACYFCGIALDEPLADYPVVPAELHSDGGRHTVTLCPSCHQKLDTVMDVVTEAVEGSPALDLGDVPDEQATDATEKATDTNAVAGSTPPDPSMDDEVVATDSEAVESTDPEQAESTHPDDAVAAADDEEPPDGEPADVGDDPLMAAMEPDVPEEFETSAGESDGEPDGEPGAGSDADAGVDFDTTPTGAASEADATGDSATETDPADGTDESGDESDGESDPAEVVSDAGASISALEYNKVMRLLQNREFPVERDEIETVAANAYGLARSDCAEVIDLAIDRELLGEEGSQLVRPD